ncbi:hypothetical protein INT44_007855 [Umbelopsis vinacea]|uniref:Uncharacterized protein n=1 Tax=Umbelopsis vinacea TaxID=44442 RepID=A0A8H7PJW7_9FUNG|nr:hypothetical protein INT44_007855 [Umbelopsis vinacea]
MSNCKSTTCAQKVLNNQPPAFSCRAGRSPIDKYSDKRRRDNAARDETRPSRRQLDQNQNKLEESVKSPKGAPVEGSDLPHEP